MAREILPTVLARRSCEFDCSAPPESANQGSHLTRQPRKPNSTRHRASTNRGRHVGAACTTITVLLGLLAITLTGGATAKRTNAEPDSLRGRRASSLEIADSKTGYIAVAPTPTGEGAWLLESNGRVTRTGDAVGRRGARTNDVFEPAIDIATSSAEGYWIVNFWGKVTPRGDAPNLGSELLPYGNRHIVSITATSSGAGYWLLSNDGVVYPFGDAALLGDARRGDRKRFVDMAVTKSGLGYYLVTLNGTIFAYGDAADLGEPGGFADTSVVGMAADADGHGYWVALSNGTVLSYGAGSNRVHFEASDAVEAVDVMSRPGGGFWTLQGQKIVDHLHPFLLCTRKIESSPTPPFYDDGYGAINPTGTYRGAYQFSRSTWNSTADHAGRPDLVGVDPAEASMIDQDLMALDLYAWQGATPWLGRCAGL